MQKKVLFITNSHPAPDYRRLWKKAVSLKEDDWEVSIICPTATKKTGKRKINSINIYYFKKLFNRTTSKGLFWGEFFDVLKVGLIMFFLYIRKKFKIVHLVNPSDTLVVPALLYKALGCQFVYEANESFERKFKFERLKITKGDKIIFAVIRRFEKYALKFADLIMVPGSKQKLRIMPVIKKAKHKIITIEPLPDLKDFYRPYLAKNLKAGYKFMALYAGSLRIERGVVKLLRAVDFIVNKAKRKDILFVLAGSGKDEQKIKEYVRQKNMAKFVHFPGWLTPKKLLEYLSVADVGLAPEPAENGKGVIRDSVFEYMAVGKPIVSFDSTMSFSRIGKAGSFVPQYNEINFAREIIKIIDNKARGRAMGEIGKIRVEKDLNWIKSEIKLLSAYERLLAKKSYQEDKNLVGKPA